mmetsp:Transcript_5954/g.11163  ORF Transcript_5954/g.11163 Transcript_5954/m.11163 type:complete len:213 (+) Transcript_5954:558-1196(+)
MTLPRELKLLLIAFASLSCSPFAPDCPIFSLPARSTSTKCPLLDAPDSAWTAHTFSRNTTWLRLDVLFIFVEATLRLACARVSKESTSSTPSTECTLRPFTDVSPFAPCFTGVMPLPNTPPPPLPPAALPAGAVFARICPPRHDPARLFGILASPLAAWPSLTNKPSLLLPRLARGCVSGTLRGKTGSVALAITPTVSSRRAADLSVLAAKE